MTEDVMKICILVMISHDQFLWLAKAYKLLLLSPTRLASFASSNSLSLISVMHAACRYCSPADYLAKSGVEKAKKASRQSIPALVGLPTALAAGLPPSARACLQTAVAPPSSAPHLPCAGQLPGHCVQGEQTPVTATPKEQQLGSIGSRDAALQSAGDAVHQPSGGQSSTRPADGAAEQQVAAPAAWQQHHLCSTTQHAQASAHMSKRRQHVSPRQLCGVAGGEYGARGEIISMFANMPPPYCYTVGISRILCCLLEDKMHMQV